MSTLTGAGGGTPAAGLRRWLAGRTLRGRLIAGLVTLLALACAGVGIATYVVLSHTLLGQLDFQLQAAGGRYAACMEQNGDHDDPHRPPGTPKLDCNHAPGLGPGTFGARLDASAWSPTGGVIGGSAPLSARGQGQAGRAAAGRPVLHQGPGLAAWATTG